MRRSGKVRRNDALVIQITHFLQAIYDIDNRALDWQSSLCIFSLSKKLIWYFGKWWTKWECQALSKFHILKLKKWTYRQVFKDQLHDCFEERKINLPVSVQLKVTNCQICYVVSSYTLEGSVIEYSDLLTQLLTAVC